MKLSALCVLLCGMSGCEKVVKFKVDDITPYVVVLSEPVADSMVSVSLKYSRFFLSNKEFRCVDDAQARLLQNGNAVSLLKASDGQYVFDCRPKAGDSLELLLNVPKYEPIHAVTRVPQQPSVEAVLTVDTTYEYSYRCQLKVKIHDPLGANYYRLFVEYSDWYLESDGKGDVDTVYVPNEAVLSTQDKVFTDVSSLDYLLNAGNSTVYDTYFLFSDELFNGREYVMTFDFDIYDCKYQNIIEKHPMYLRMSALSADMYRYRRTRDAYSNNEDFLSEPVQIYCNIDGGIGIFAASAETKVELKPVYK